MKKIKWSILLICFGFIFTGCNKDSTAKAEVTEVQTEEETADEIPKEETEEVVIEDTHEGEMRSYLSGEWVSTEIGTKRPIAVMLNNLKIAVPQSGIANADIVYEAPVEGGITRLMGIFEDYEDLDKIGSVRSCRNYYIDFFMGFDAIYCHFGQAAYAVPVLNLANVDNLNGLEGIGSTVYYRTTDRVAPHNAYTSAAGIDAGIEAKGFRRNYNEDHDGQFVFNTNDDEEINLTDGTEAKYIQPGYVINKPWFEYHEVDGLYYRYQYDSAQIDELTNEQIAYKNVIIQYTQWEYYDSNGYLNINTSSGGQGKYITNGKAIDITWKKDYEFGPTTFMDSDGNEITLNQGKTWICIVLNTETDQVNISNELVQ